MANSRKGMIVGIDIGSGNLRAVGAVRHENAKYPVVVASYKKSIEGIDRGNIIDEREVAKEITDAIISLEEESKMFATHTLVSLGALGLASCHTSGYAQVSRGDASITELDIENAIKDGHRLIPDIRNKSIIHSVPMDYKADGNKIQGAIVGVRGNKLEVKTLYVTHPLQCMNTLKKTLERADVRVTDIIAGPIAEALPLLTKKQKIAGVALVNIGQGVTSLLVYEKNVPLLVSTIPVGGDDITKDIALGMKVTLEEAEEIKCGRSINPYSKRRVEEIIEARLEDLCHKINKELARIMRSELLPAGVIVCGSSSLSPRLEFVFRNELRLPIKIVTNELSRATGDVLRDSGWARSYGLTFLAPNDGEKEAFKELLTSITNRVKKVVSRFLP